MSASNDRPAPGCLLCASSDSKRTDQLSGAELRSLWREVGINFSEAAYGTIAPGSSIILYECLSCGLRYFDPQFAGGEQFYTQLGENPYYSHNRPEFLRMATILSHRPPGRVLDVGCGEGAFLDHASRIGWQTFGTELNRSASTFARARGHTIYNDDLSSLVTDWPEMQYDAITAFQVVEHVPDPVQFLRLCGSLVLPAGLIGIAVPHDRGIYRLAPLDPHQWPPHHITRWRKRDIRRLAESAGLTLLSMAGETLYGSAIAYFWELNNRMRRAIDRPVRLQDLSFVATCLAFAYRKTGMKYFAPKWGQSIFALLQRNAESK